MQNVDIVSKDIHRPDVNQLDGAISWYGLDYQKQIGGGGGGGGGWYNKLII